MQLPALPCPAGGDGMTGTVETSSDTGAPDIETMRQTVGRLLPPDDPAPTGEDLATLISVLRGHMELLMPEVHAAAVRLPKDDVPRYCALACIGEAELRLKAKPSPASGGDIAYARRLARSLAALCDHYETVTGMRMCVACDQPIRAGDESLPYDQLSPSGGAARTGSVHARCKNAVRRR
ncbi:DUF6415 family natural product biosynthesis protein [Streptomyces sp. NPDC001978]|uniref:DUF6415 family natural product biosynthesis protein n=1 Tax=Streptomyces sp. NPDC001978 TaxID=3364627 RepID=UPI0036D02762